MTDPSIAQSTKELSAEREATIEKQVDEILSSYEGGKDELIAVLQRVQQTLGYVPELAMGKIAKFLRLPASTVYGVGTFYAQFKLVPTGRNIVKVCRGTACHVRGSGQILQELELQLGIKAGETTADMEYSLETIACFGSCALAPVVVINDKVLGRMTVPRVKEILKK
jgi:NADH-quinone oxidoreductase subunit E